VGQAEAQQRTRISPLLLGIAGGLGATGVAVVVVAAVLAAAVVTTIVVLAQNPALLETLLAMIPGQKQKTGTVRVKVN
jgi:hypothetical protein